MKIAVVTVAVVAGLVLTGMVFQGAVCPQKGIQSKKPYCSKEDKILAPADVKAGKCAKDETAVIQITVCTTNTFSFSCHPNKEGAAAGKS